MKLKRRDSLSFSLQVPWQESRSVRNFSWTLLSLSFQLTYTDARAVTPDCGRGERERKEDVRIGILTPRPPKEIKGKFLDLWWKIKSKYCHCQHSGDSLPWYSTTMRYIHIYSSFESQQITYPFWPEDEHASICFIRFIYIYIWWKNLPLIMVSSHSIINFKFGMIDLFRSLMKDNCWIYERKLLRKVMEGWLWLTTPVG